MMFSYTFLGVQQPLYNKQGHCTGYRRVVARHDLLADVLDFVHPGNFKVLPPSPFDIACKGVQIGLTGDMNDFFMLN